MDDSEVFFRKSLGDIYLSFFCKCTKTIPYFNCLHWDFLGQLFRTNSKCIFLTFDEILTIYFCRKFFWYEQVNIIKIKIQNSHVKFDFIDNQFTQYFSFDFLCQSFRITAIHRKLFSRLFSILKVFTSELNNAEEMFPGYMYVAMPIPKWFMFILIKVLNHYKLSMGNSIQCD